MSARLPEPTTSSGDRRGTSLVEIVVALVVFAVTILGLSAAAGIAVRQTARANAETELWAAVQRAADSLMAVGPDSISSGSDTVAGHPMSWWVIGADSQQVGLQYAQIPSLTGAETVDTLILYLPEGTP